MSKWEERAANLEQLLRLETFPLGVRIIEDEKEIPVKSKRPTDLKQKMAMCQLITLARRMGWTTVALPEEINVCFFPLKIGRAHV